MRVWWEAITAPGDCRTPSSPNKAPGTTARRRPRAWADRDPEAAARLSAARAAVSEIAEAHRLPTENLLSPDTIRRLAWAPPADADLAAVSTFLREHHAREWQIGLTAEALTAAIAVQPAPKLD